MIENEKSIKNRSILEHHLKDYLNKQKEWMIVKNLQQLEYFQHDIDLYQKLENYDKNQFTMKTLKDSEKIKFKGNPEFNLPQNINDPNCTRLLIKIKTNTRYKQFKMSDHHKEVNAAFGCFINLNANSTKIFSNFISDLAWEEAGKYSQSLNWFELGIFLDDTGSDSDNGNVTIVVYYQITILHYMLLAICRFDYKIARQWFEKYRNYVETELRRNHGTERSICYDENHHVLRLNTRSRRLLHGIPIGRGKSNREITTKRSRTRQNKKPLSTNNKGYGYNNTQYRNNDDENNLNSRFDALLISDNKSRKYVPPHKRK